MRRQERNTDVKISVDHDVCQGHAQCTLLCPEVFELDDDGYVVLLTTEPAAEYEAAVRDAVDACPEQAIKAR
jgi:ferredoxin